MDFFLGGGDLGGVMGVDILQLEIKTSGVISLYDRISPHISEF